MIANLYVRCYVLALVTYCDILLEMYRLKTGQWGSYYSLQEPIECNGKSPPRLNQ